jgi:hypothetical protein
MPGQLKGLVAATFKQMSSRWEEEVGIWRLRARLGFYLKKVEQGERSSLPDGEGESLASAGSVTITSSILCAVT